MDPSQAARLKDIVEDYKSRHASFQKQAEELSARCARIGNYRGLSFLAFVIGAGFYLSRGGVPAMLVGGAGLGTFIFLVRHHAQVLARQEQAERFSLVNQQGLFRVTNQWQSLPRSGVNFAPAEHPYAGDLDLFGPASLYQRISLAHTRYGQRILAEWLAQPASLGDIEQRQAAVSELSQDRAFREQLEALGMALVEKKRDESTRVLSDGPNPERLLKWAQSPQPLATHPLLTLASFLLPCVTSAGIVAQISFGKPVFFWLVPLLISLVVLSIAKVPTSAAFEAVSTTEGAFLRYGELLGLIEAHKGQAPWFVAQHKRLVAGSGRPPSEVMRRFRSIVSWYDLRHNGMVYPFVNTFFLWDVHCTRALENWKTQSGAALHDWFSVIGEYEALSSLSGLLADDPAAILPELSSASGAAATLSASNMGHPLLSASNRITNTLEAVSPGQGLLVTGSNMSGKSTFLRALGVNCVLALAGGPVIASAMQLPRLVLGTSIRVSDSLKSGVSHFYAEVQKLAHVVELAEQQNYPVLFLLDEVLHGTNSRERQIGARWVLAKLLEEGAFGIITTHDMELCRLPEPLMSQVRQHHFRELVENGEMSFDYKLRSGPVTSGNALRLMRRVGLEVPLEE